MGFWSRLFGVQQDKAHSNAKGNEVSPRKSSASDAEFDELMARLDKSSERYRLPDLIVINVNGKPPYHWADSHKHDLEMMMACAEAELRATEESGGYQAPAPYFTERVAILARKQHRYDLEVQACEALLASLSRWRKLIKARGLKPGRDVADVAAGPTVENIKSRITKARELLAKSKTEKTKLGLGRQH